MFESPSTSEIKSSIGFDHYIPLDKSWIIRMGILDLMIDSDHTVKFLQNYSGVLSDDLKALLRASRQWLSEEVVDVGESGTLFRFMQYMAWKQGRDVNFQKAGTLETRKITNDPRIIGLSIPELLKLDGGTSQWASASILCNDTGTSSLRETPYKLALTIEAKQHWLQTRANGQSWRPKIDSTLENQALAFIKWLNTGLMEFKPLQAEDFPFAVFFDLMTTEEGERLWPALRHHETDRISEVTYVQNQIKNMNPVDSADHRIIQAAAMRHGNVATFTTKSIRAVNKSWPTFWKFLESSSRL